MARRRLISPKRKRMISVRLTLGVVALHAAMLLTLALIHKDPPRQGNLGQLLWAAAHRPSFYVLVVVLIAAPVLTIFAWPIRGRHRAWLAISWAVFAVITGMYYTHRLTVMLDILWKHG